MFLRAKSESVEKQIHAFSSLCNFFSKTCPACHTLRDGTSAENKAFHGMIQTIA
jgi:hypothetical protein